MKKLLLFIVSFAFTVSVSANQLVGVVVGADKDAHGCIGSAGYTWSAPMKKCIRSWENYTIDAESVPKTGFSKLDKLIQSKADKTIRNFKKDAETEIASRGDEEGFEIDPSMYSLMISYHVAQTGAITSVKMEVSTYLGGAHGSTVATTWNYDTQKKSPLNLSKVVSKKDLATIAKNIEKVLVAEYGEDIDMDWMREGLSPKKVSNYQNFTLETDSSGKVTGITFYFQEYQVVAYAYGRPTVHVNLSDMSAEIR